MKNIFIICPVRNCSRKVKSKIDQYVDKLEKNGYKVHYNHRDVDQTDDGIGLKICESHRNAMRNADEIHVWWDDDSKGSYFDLGMAFMMSLIGENKFILINKPEPTPYKSYKNILIELSKN